jgi:hypothetical protein
VNNVQKKFQEDETKSPVMSRSISHPARREKTIYRRQSHNDRMTQSMYADSASSRPNSGVSFFVDFNDVANDADTKKSTNRRSAAFLKTMSREESDRDLSDVSEDMQVKSQMLVSCDKILLDNTNSPKRTKIMKM